MNRFITLLMLGVFLNPGASSAQTNEAPDPYKATLDRLASLTNVAITDWRYHSDVPYPEDAALDDSGWPTVKPGESWKTGTRVLRHWIEIPEKMNGYAIRGARVKLELFFGSDQTIGISVFSNSALVERADEDSQQPLLLSESAQPGQKFLIAARVDAAEVSTQIYRSRLVIEPPMSRPDPGLLREEILSARPMIAAFPEGKPEHESQLDAAVRAISFAGLDRGDQGAFDESLREAQAKLQPLNPWLKRFTIRAAGNSHIDMAWLWPWTETVEVVRNTFRSALDLMREYPDFTFTMSSARTYAWMEEKYPELFREIQQRVKEGRWEVIGGM